MTVIRLVGDSAELTVRVASSFASRARGLLGAPTLEAGQGLLIEPCNSIHTCFMGQALDLVGLGRLDDGTAEITWLSQRVGPWRFRWARRGTRSILELPTGEIERSHLQVGDRLRVAT